jgi:hypothetical protein
MSTWVKDRVRVAGTVLLAAALVAGCSGGSSSPAARTRPTPTNAQPVVAASTSKVVLASVQTTAAAKSARVSMSISSSGLGNFSINGDGVVDFANGDSQFVLHVGGAAAAALPGGLEERTVDNTVYLKFPLLTGQDSWLAADVGKLGPAAALVPGLDNTDPRQFLGALEAISDNVKKVGSESVRGVDTTHYHATLDLGKALDQAKIPPSLRDAEKQFAQSNDAQTPTIPVDVFVDGDGYVRRIALDLGSFLGEGDGGSSTAVGSGLTESIDLYDFGTPVNVQAPPPDQVSREPLSGGLAGLDRSATSSSSSL